MPRKQTTDFYQNFRFFAEALPSAEANAGTDFLAESDPDLGIAGFTQITTPEMTTEVAEYREGHSKNMRKFPGTQSWSDITMTRGLMVNASAFFKWAMKAQRGEEYRAEVVTYHWQRASKTPGFAEVKSGSRQYKLKEAWASRIKLASDLDATASDIATNEIDVVYEDCEITQPDGTVLES